MVARKDFRHALNGSNGPESPRLIGCATRGFFVTPSSALSAHYWVFSPVFRSNATQNLNHGTALSLFDFPRTFQGPGFVMSVTAALHNEEP